MSKAFLITGTSSGFGRILTEKLLDRGDRVAATVRRADALDDLRDRYGDRLWVATLDVTDTAAVRRVVDRAFASSELVGSTRVDTAGHVIVADRGGPRM